MTLSRASAHLPISPLALSCPMCKAKPRMDCQTSEGSFSMVHVARIKAAIVRPSYATGTQTQSSLTCKPNVRYYLS